MATNHSPDVAAILAQVRAEVQAQRQARIGDGTESDSQSAIERQLQRCVEQIEITRVISAHWPLESRTLYERAWVVVHKLVRRFLRWYINPIVAQQNDFNDVTARTLRLLVEAQRELRGQLAALDQANELPAAAPPSVGPPATPPPAPAADSAQTIAPDPAPPAAPPRNLEALSFDELQALVAHHGQREAPAALADTKLRPMLLQLAPRQHINAHWPLVSHTPLQRLAVLVQKLTRRYLRWLINPIVEQQNAFNGALTEAIAPLLAADSDLRAELAERRARTARSQ